MGRLSSILDFLLIWWTDIWQELYFFKADSDSAYARPNTQLNGLFKDMFFTLMRRVVWRR